MFNKFMAGDKVSYVGEKFKGDATIAGMPGIVCAPVTNVPGWLVVDFGSDSIVVAQDKLVPFQGHLKGSPEETKKKEPKVEKRRNRRRDSEDEG